MSQKGHVWTAPDWQGLSSRLQHWSEQPCVRPSSAARLAAGHNALRGSGPGQKLAFDNAVARVGCPDRQIDRLCITCCLPLPIVTSRQMPDAISSHPKRGGLPVTASLRHQGPGDPRELVGECNSRNLRRPPCQQCHKPGSMLGPMDFGIADDGERSGREEATQIAIPSFADVAKLVCLRSNSASERDRSRLRSPVLTGRPWGRQCSQPEPWPAVGRRRECD